MAGISDAAMAPDIQNPDDHTGAEICKGLAVDKWNEYVGMIAFIGWLMGLGEEEDVNNAREAVKSAVRSLMEAPEPSALEKRMNVELDAFRKMRDTYDIPGIPADEISIISSQIGGYSSGMHPLDWTEFHLLEYTSGVRRAGFTSNIPMYLSKGISSATIAYITKACNHYDKACELALEIKKAREEYWDQYWGKIWTSAEEWFNKVYQYIDNGEVLAAVCTIIFEGVFFIVEEAAELALKYGLALTGVGAGAAVAFAVVTTVGEKVIKISLHAKRAANLGNQAIIPDMLTGGKTFDLGEHDPTTLPKYDEITEELKQSHPPADPVPDTAQTTSVKDPDAETTSDNDKTDSDEDGVTPNSPLAEKIDAFKSKVSQKDRDLAASTAGLSASAARLKVKAAFAEVFGVNAENLAGMSDRLPLMMKGFPPPEKLYQWKNPTIGTGEFFDPIGTSSPTELGISSIGREKYVYPVEGKGAALSGYGTPSYKDSFTVRGRIEETKGGTEQWVIGANEKPTNGVPLKVTWRDLPENRHWKKQDDGSFISDEENMRLVPVEVPNRDDPSKMVRLWRAEPL